MKKYNLTQRQSQKMINPYKKMQTIYKISKQRMRNMNFTIIEKFSDMIDVSKMKSTYNSHIDFPNEFTLITPTMV